MIANCSGDERGKLHGGKAGDNNGREWRLRGWYNRPWSCVLRFEDRRVANLIAELAEEGARNNHIGYDQSQRLTFWKHLERNGYHPKNIKVNCETDCSASTLAICKAVGYLLDIQKMKAINESGYSGNAKAILVKAGAKVLDDKKYRTSDKYLKRGDILLYIGHHMAINLTDGSAIEKKPVETAKKPVETTKKGYTGEYPSLDNGREDKTGHGWYQMGDGTVTLKNYPTQIKRLQALVNWINGGSIKEDGEYGKNTTAAVKLAQTNLHAPVTGVFDYTTLKAAKEYKK